MSNTFVQWAADLDQLPDNVGVGPGITQGPWDYVVLGGEVVPGVARVTVSPGTGLDIQKPKGGKRATIVDNGDPPANVKIELSLSPGDVEEFRDFIIPILRTRDKDGGRAPLQVEHPACEMWGIGVLAIGKISMPPPESGGQLKVTLSAVEWAEGPEPVKRVKKVAVSTDPALINQIAGQNIFDPFAPSGTDVLDGLEF